MDLDNDGVRGPSEPVLGGVSVRIAGPNGFVDVAVTDTNGSYCFVNLPPGDYTIEIVSGVPARFGFLTGQKQTVNVLGVQEERATVSFRVTPLAYTGIADAGRLLAAAGVFLLAGVIVLSGGRRRSAPRHASPRHATPSS